MMRLRPTIAICALLASAAGHAHEVWTDYSDEACVPGGATFAAANEVAATADGAFVFTAGDDRGTVRYTVTPGRPDGSNGLFSVACALDDRAPFTLTGGVMITARDLQGREIALNGRRSLSAFDLADVDADGPGGYTREPTGHGPCIRLGDALPVAPHTEGHVTVPLDLPAGRWLIGVRYMDDRDDQAGDAFIALSVRGEEFGRIALDRDDDAWREQLFPVDLQAGDVLRIDGRADADGADFCRISQILLQPEGGLGGGMAADLRGSVLTLTQQAPIAEGVPALSAEVRLVGRALRCRLRPLGEASAPAGIAGLSLLPSEGTADVRLPIDPFLNERVVVLADGGLYSTFIDRFNSHCTDYRPGAVALEGGVEAFGRLQYLPNSAGTCNDFSEDLYLTASPRLLDVLPSFRGRRPTPGRAAISDRLVFDHWRMQSGEGLERQVRLMAGCGMTDILALWHTWMHYGYDRRQPQFTPANPDRWTEEQFRAAVAAATAAGWRVAVHENYNHMDWDSPYNAPTPAREFGEPDRPGDPGPEEAATLTCAAPGEDLSRQPRNAWAFARLADLRVAPGPLSRPLPPAFPIASDKMLFYSQIESHRIRDLYATTAGYLDVTPSVRPGMSTWDIHVDLDARNPNARGWDQAYRNAWRLFDHHRSIFEITTGEGGSAATYHAGHIDAVERQIAGQIDGPVLPEHELRVVRPLALHHGMGYYSRYFPEDAPAESWDFDRYRAMEIAYGHAGFLGDSVFPGGLPGPEAIREYYLLRALQAAYADAPLQDVQYWDGAAWISAEEGLAQDYDFSAARLRITYGNGLQIALNFDRAQDWAMQIGEMPFVLPPSGWMALCEREELAAGSILADGARRDFLSCPDYEYRNSRDADDGVDGLVARMTGLPGLSDRDAPALLVCLREGARRLEIEVPLRLRGGQASARAERLNLTVINVGGEARLPVSVVGEPEGPCTAITWRGVRPGGIRPEVTWDAPRPGTWRLSLAYAYTDPQHTDVANRVPLTDAFDGRSLVIGAGEGEVVEGSLRRNADFVEVRATLRYPWLAPADAPLTFTLTDLLWGQNDNDDYATDVRLVLTNEATGETVELPFPELGEIERTTLPGLGGELTFPANSITTFELG